MSNGTKERRFVSGNDRITVYENNLVTLTFEDGTAVERLEPRRLFPVNLLSSYITLLDKEGREVAVIRELTDLDKDSREIIRRSLEDYYLVPHILRIVTVTEKYGTLHWKVETERGIKEFDIRNRNHDIRINKDGCVRVRDSDDNRYVIPDYKRLDKHSRNYLISDL